MPRQDRPPQGRSLVAGKKGDWNFTGKFSVGRGGISVVVQEGEQSNRNSGAPAFSERQQLSEGEGRAIPKSALLKQVVLTRLRCYGVLTANISFHSHLLYMSSHREGV